MRKRLRKIQQLVHSHRGSVLSPVMCSQDIKDQTLGQDLCSPGVQDCGGDGGGGVTLLVTPVQHHVHRQVAQSDTSPHTLYCPPPLSALGLLICLLNSPLGSW